MVEGASGRLTAKRSRVNVLYVEDHAELARIVASQFLSGHEVTIVSNLVEARAAWACGGFDAMLVDYDLPDGKGDTLVREVRAEASPILVIAVSGREIGMERLMAAGADRMCRKRDLHQLTTLLAP